MDRDESFPVAFMSAEMNMVFTRGTFSWTRGKLFDQTSTLPWVLITLIVLLYHLYTSWYEKYHCRVAISDQNKPYTDSLFVCVCVLAKVITVDCDQNKPYTH